MRPVTARSGKCRAEATWPTQLDDDQPACVVHRAGLLDRGALYGERQRDRRVDRPRPVELAQAANVAVVEAVAGGGKQLLQHGRVAAVAERPL
jgi:hypothetical protein